MQLVAHGQEASPQRELCNITAVEGEMIMLSNAMTLPISLIKKNFVHNYCRTCHSFQGSTIEESITIFDHKFAYATRKWLYTAVTRATDLKKSIRLRLRRERREGEGYDTILY